MSINRNFTCQVEFIGGPIDGFVMAVDHPPRPFIGLERVPEARGRSLWCRLLQLFRWSRPATVRVSIYEFRSQEAKACYWYLGTYAMSPEQRATHRHATPWTDVNVEDLASQDRVSPENEWRCRGG
jgi:hypothetical protein